MGRTRKDYTGKRYGRLTVVRYSHDVVGIVAAADRPGGVRKCARSMWECQCDCGGMATVWSSSLVTGGTRSCGCYHLESARANGKKNATHGWSGTKEYGAWSSMRGRCFNPTRPNYADYGGRGITVCARWADSFDNFLADMGSCPDETYSLDRIDNDGDYGPGNCRWATRAEQANNTRANHFLTYAGRTQTLSQWATERGLRKETLSSRIGRLGWPVEKALTTPVGGKRRT